MVDVRKYRLRDAMLTLEKLECCFGGRYTGVIKAVIEAPLFNRFKGGDTGRREELVLKFEDGERAGVNVSMMKTLERLYGPETDGWCGKRVSIFAKHGKRVNRKTGELLMERGLMAAADVASRDVGADDDGEAPVCAPEKVAPLDDSDIPFGGEYGTNARRH
jgi:hypothetical protein